VKRILIFLAVALVGTLIVGAATGCGGDDGDGASPTEVSGETPDSQEVVHIELDEWSVAGEDGAAVESPAAGQVTFEVHNIGETVHALTVIKTDLDHASLPVDGVMVDEEAAGEVVGEIADFAAGETEVASFDLEAGSYALICNIAGHYEQGMSAAMTVE
jgi:uncharacterized cupredoxin-like copper-binding protein